MHRRNFIRQTLGLALGVGILKLVYRPKKPDWTRFYNSGGSSIDIPDIDIDFERVLTNEPIIRHYTSEDYYNATH